MTAEIITVEPAGAEHALSRCRETISRGGVIVYPTDTFYALGVDPGNRDAVERLFRIKGRAPDQPVLLLLHDSGQVENWADAVSDEARRLMERHWPGPLTLVFRAGRQVSPRVTGGTGTIGLRVPGNELTRRLLACIGIPLTGTSANRAGENPPRTAQEAASFLGGQVDIILDGGRAARDMPSTVADVTGDRVRILRAGAVNL